MDIKPKSDSSTKLWLDSNYQLEKKPFSADYLINESHHVSEMKTTT